MVTCAQNYFIFSCEVFVKPVVVVIYYSWLHDVPDKICPLSRKVLSWIFVASYKWLHMITNSALFLVCLLMKLGVIVI